VLGVQLKEETNRKTLKKYPVSYAVSWASGCSSPRRRAWYPISRERIDRSTNDFVYSISNKVFELEKCIKMHLSRNDKKRSNLYREENVLDTT
jgi:hypothetical protein